MSQPRPSVVQLHLDPSMPDVAGRRVAESAKTWLGLELGRVKTVQVYVIDFPLEPGRIHSFASEALRDRVLERVVVDEPWADPAFKSFVLVAKHPGVTDDVGISAQRTLADWLQKPIDTTTSLGGKTDSSPPVRDGHRLSPPSSPLDERRGAASAAPIPDPSSFCSCRRTGPNLVCGTQHIFSQTVYLFENAIPAPDLAKLADQVLGNPLINQFRYGAFDTLPWVHPVVSIAAQPTTYTISLDLPDDQLLALSQRMVLSLNLEELHAIQAHFADPAVQALRQARDLSLDPTDCELEVLAQTWSEHCKHKEFNALIQYRDLDTGEERVVDSLFKTCIRGSTEAIRERLRAAGNDWLVKIFSDNAGVVRIDDDRVFVWKVETHNTPSALDPYGGAITGILGNNRDPLGTGVGGGKLLFNTNVLCFGPPDYDKPLLAGQLHPARIMEGVRHGIEDGGNKSGVPTVNGSIVFDDRYAGKPLVYCGTGAIMASHYLGKPSWHKPIDPGDRIIMAGGRVGKDGIHGATFSSTEVDENSPRTAVQIGSPITQKLCSDFMQRACALGLIKCSTDNGAGGLSSSVGELAIISGGAVVQLEHVPLKYPGLMPWEIFVSEAQERMQLVVEPHNLPEVMALAELFEVELTDIGEFNDSGYLEVRYGTEVVAYLEHEFLHEGVPRKHMVAEWSAPAVAEPDLPEPEDHDAVLLQLLGADDICSRERVIRQYDHEVKGKTVIKPLMGAAGVAPQDAAVMRFDFDSYDGVAVSNGILPRYGDIDAYAMSAGAFDEGMRQIVAVGGQLPDPQDDTNRFWTVNDNFCVPDSDYHPVHNPDGKYKLAQLVRMAEALYDMSTFFGIPMTSGKDSMKNDFRVEDTKISVPPTILYSMAARIPDVRRCVTAQFQSAGDVICLLGETKDELGGSQYYKLHGQLGANVPRVDMQRAKQLYDLTAQAIQKGLVASCHDLSDGGLAVALAECCFGSGFGCEVEISVEKWGLSPTALLYSESHSRFVASVPAHKLQAFLELMGDRCLVLGRATLWPHMWVCSQGEPIIDQYIGHLLEAWQGGSVGGVS